MFYRVALPVAVPASVRHWGGLLLLLVLLAAGRARAQPSTGGPTPAPAAVPLDGGATLVLAAGAAYGLRRLRRATR